MAAAIIAGFAAYECNEKKIETKQKEVAIRAGDYRGPNLYFYSDDWLALSEMCILISFFSGLCAGVTVWDQLDKAYEQVYKKE